MRIVHRHQNGVRTFRTPTFHHPMQPRTAGGLQRRLFPNVFSAAREGRVGSWATLRYVYTKTDQLQCLEAALCKNYSGRLIFCKFEKKSLLRIVEALKIVPDRFATTCLTSSGKGIPSRTSTRSRGLSALRPSAISSFSKVLITKYRMSNQQRLQFGIILPGRSLTNCSIVSKDCIVSGSILCR